MDHADPTSATIDAAPGAVAPASGAAPAQTLALERYRLVRRLGAGAFGVVWLAHDEALDRAVAVKRIEARDPQVAERAAREAHAAARLQHPAIVALYEFGRDEDAVFLVSELVRGRTLADLEDEGALSDRDVLRIGAALCDALEHAHARGVVHRDVKPANVIVPDSPQGEAGIAKLTDFGVARIAGNEALTRTGDIVGTLAYMAPEQAEGRPVTGAADLYATALVLYEALSGVNPIRAPGAAATARRVGARLPPLGRLRRDLPRGVCAAIDRAVLPRAEDRGTPADLRDALDAALDLAGRSVGPVAPAAIDALASGEHAAPAPLPWAPGEDAVTGPGEAPGTGARVLAGACGAALTAVVLALAAAPGLTPAGIATAAGAAGAATALLPRLGWLATLAGLAATLVSAGAPGAATVLLLVGLAAPLLLPGRGTLWGVGALAPALGLAGAALAWPALAGQAGTAWRRAALGAAGLWWIVLAEALARPALLLGDAPGTDAPGAWTGGVPGALTGALWPALSSGALLLGLLWGVAAAVLPLLARGRSAAVDLVAVSAWAAALAAGSAAAAAALPWGGPAPEPRGLWLGAAAAGAVALLAAGARGGPDAEPRP